MRGEIGKLGYCEGKSLLKRQMGEARGRETVCVCVQLDEGLRLVDA